MLFLPSASQVVKRSLGLPFANPYAAVAAIPAIKATKMRQQMGSVHDLFITGPFYNSSPFN